MAPKRANVPNTAFGKAPGALDKLTGRVPSEDAALPPDIETATPQDVKADTPENSKTVSRQSGVEGKANTEKFTIYVSSEQLDKLDELALAYRKRTGKRINRNVIMRKLIDVCDLDLLLQSTAD
jgi:hypothetical protein